MSLLVLDLDGTLTKSDNMVRFSFFMIRRKVRFAFIIPLLILLKLRMITNEKVKKYYAILILKDLDVNYIKRCAVEFTESKIFLSDLNNDVFSFISKYPLSERVVISSNFEFLVEPICKALGIKSFRAIKLEEKNERFTGEIFGVIPHGEAKIKVYNECFQDLSDRPTIGLGDHPSDLPLLKYLSEGFMVSFNRKRDLTNIISIKG